MSHLHNLRLRLFFELRLLMNVFFSHHFCLCTRTDTKVCYPSYIMPMLFTNCIFPEKANISQRRPAVDPNRDILIQSTNPDPSSICNHLTHLPERQPTLLAPDILNQESMYSSRVHVAPEMRCVFFPPLPENQLHDDQLIKMTALEPQVAQPGMECSCATAFSKAAFSGKNEV